MGDATLSDRALEVLLGDSLRHVVDLVLRARDGLVEAHAADGSVGFDAAGARWVRGRNPLERRDPSAFSPLSEEIANLHPGNRANHYPLAYESASQLFADPRAPDLAVVHAPSHNWEERGGHRGEHGSLDVVQSRAPIVLSGAGVRRRGMVAGHARMIDVAPTLATLAGAEPEGGCLLAGQQGRVIDEALDGTSPRRVVAFLLDGTNANVLHAMAQSGELPTVARLLGEGTVLSDGIVASFPSVTLVNHTTALTGVHPGRHGVLHNAYYDRAVRRQVVTNARATWHLARGEISADVETLFEAVGRRRLGFTAAVNEPADRGAGYSTFDLVRRGEVGELRSALPDPREVPAATRAFVDAARDYAWATAADHVAVQQAIAVGTGAAGNPRPRLLWVNLILPDAAAHNGGPHSEMARAGLRDTDRRLGAILDSLDWGAGETAFALLADHGMEETDPACKGDFDEALERAGIPFRDEAYGFLYLGEARARARS
ncbi:MAG: alkaline phosphatase family protein [Acidobacteria bacterium]|nr:alkaline phosphatase family protein [Acidobacteriota bacterium]